MFKNLKKHFDFNKLFVVGFYDELYENEPVSDTGFKMLIGLGIIFFIITKILKKSHQFALGVCCLIIGGGAIFNVIRFLIMGNIDCFTALFLCLLGFAFLKAGLSEVKHG